MEDIKELIQEMSTIDEIEAIALAGSRAINLDDKLSDYDVCVYYKKPIDSDKRKNILNKYCKYMEIENKYWETEDDCILNNGTIIEFIYRDIAGFEENLKSVVIDGNAYNGYTTCMWDNLLNCKILFDRNNILKDLKKRYDIPYPKKLEDNIIKKNLELLDGYIPSFSDQIKKASKRGDIVSVNHRITEFLASYFDLIFAYNKVTHPGEKRMIENCIRKCNSLPQDFEQNIKLLLSNLYSSEIINYALNNILENVKILVK